MIADMGRTMDKVFDDMKNLWEKCLLREEIGRSVLDEMHEKSASDNTNISTNKYIYNEYNIHTMTYIYK